MSKKLSAAHPGEVLREKFLVPMKLSPYAVARVIGVPRTRIERLVNGQTALTADTALRLAKAFRATPAFWMGLETQYTASSAGSGCGHCAAPIPFSFRSIRLNAKDRRAPPQRFSTD
jgi:addiction module HigA family antidote